MKEITFSGLIKKEICTNQYPKNTILSILSSFFSNNSQISISSDGIKLEIYSQYNFIIRFISDLIQKTFKIKHHILYSKINNFNKKRNFKISISENIDIIKKQLQLTREKKTKFINTKEGKKGFLIGAFLSGGSIGSLQKNTYHLELRTKKIFYARLIQNIFNDLNLSISLIKRRKAFVLYIKRVQDISDFLKFINANESMLKLEDQKISRDLMNQMNRLNNIDISNIKKCSIASSNQIEQINKIISSPKFKKKSKNFQLFCLIRTQNPSASLNDIVKIFKEKYNIRITKGGLSHYLYFLKNM